MSTHERHRIKTLHMALLQAIDRRDKEAKRMIKSILDRLQFRNIYKGVK